MLQVLYKKACNQAKKMVDINDGVFIYFLENVLIKRVEMRCIASQKGMRRISKRVRKKNFMYHSKNKKEGVVHH